MYSTVEKSYEPQIRFALLGEGIGFSQFLDPNTSPSDHLHHAKLFKGKPRQFALGELVPNWYKSFPPDHNGQVKMNDSTILI